ncbi:MAG: DUF4190 domain-containing protein [Mycobacteriaceae bacterium]|nr:DUF4190 domain-containing protein [Mycobacteriaceae bacterium]
MTEPSDTRSDHDQSPAGTEPTTSTTAPGGYPPPWPHAGVLPPPCTPKNGLGIASLVIAVIALLSVWSVLGGIIGGIIAVTLGALGHGRVRRGQANNGGVAIAGIVLGTLAVILGLVFIALWAGFWQFVGGTDYVDCLQTAGSDPVRQQQCVDEFQHDVENKFGVTLTPMPSP